VLVADLRAPDDPIATPPVDQKNELLGQLRIDRSSGPPGAPRRWVLAGLTAAVILVGGIATWLLGSEKPVVVKVAAARSMAGSSARGSVLDATGYVTARRQATVSAKITGKVNEVLIEEGMRVEQGQVLARLDDTEAKAQFGLAQAQLGAARSQLTEIGSQLANAEREAKRHEDLAARNLVSASALDAARTAAESLRARLASQRSSVAVAVEAVQVAQVQLDNTIVRAPFSGVVTVKAAQPGEMISPISAGGGFTRTGIGTIVDMDSLEVEVDVNEAFINRVTPGQPVEAVLNAYPDWRIPAEVIAIIPAADRTKATVRVRIAIKSKDPRIVPDMGVRVAFMEARETQEQSAAPPVQPGVLVPGDAVLESGGETHVFVLNGSTVEWRAVKPGSTIGGSRQVLAGLRDGERVVVAPPANLEAGDTVEIAEGG
jgi:RND family efflux transporter MFP subunit